MLRVTSLAFALCLRTVQSQQDDPNAMYYLRPDCQEQTNALTIFPQLQNEWTSLIDQVHKSKISSMCKESTNSGGEDGCLLDYSEFSNDVESICTQVGGTYAEGHYRIECPTSSEGQEQSTSTAHVTAYNMPLCLGNICTPNHAHGIVEGSVRLLEEELSADLGVTCSVDYNVEVIVNPKSVQQQQQQCPTSLGAAPETCRPLAAKIDGWLCDCYSFCGDRLVGCLRDGVELLSLDSVSELELCSDDVTAGCTYALFSGAYDMASSSSSPVSTSTMKSFVTLGLLVAFHVL